MDENTATLGCNIPHLVTKDTCQGSTSRDMSNSRGERPPFLTDFTKHTTPVLVSLMSLFPVLSLSLQCLLKDYCHSDCQTVIKVLNTGKKSINL